MSSTDPGPKKSALSAGGSPVSGVERSAKGSTAFESLSAAKNSELKDGSTLVPTQSKAVSVTTPEQLSAPSSAPAQKTAQSSPGKMALAKMSVLDEKIMDDRKLKKKTYCSTGKEGFPPVTDYSAGEERELVERTEGHLEAGAEYTCRISEKAAVNIMKPIHYWNEEERDVDEDVIDYIEREALLVEKSPFDEEPPREIIGYVYVIPHPDTSLIDVALRPQAEQLLQEDELVSVSSLSDISDPGIEQAFNQEGDFSKNFMDAVGEKHYRYMCEQLNVMPSAHFIKSLMTDTVSFRHYGLNPRAIRPITEALYHNIFVKNLDLSNNWLNEDSAYHLAELMRENNCIVRLDLTGCRLGPVSAWKISEGMVVNRTLKELRLSGNEFGDAGAEALVRGIEDNMSIYKLDLSHNELGGGAGALFGPVLMDQFTIRELDLSWNKLYHKDGFKKLMAGLKSNVGLTYLNLAGNALNLDSAKSIRPFIMKNESVKTLDLSFNRFTNASLNIIKRGMGRNKTLRYLKLGHNPITFEAPKGFLQALKKPTCVLSLLDLEDIWVDKEFAQLEKEIAAERDFLAVKAGVIGNYVIKGPDELGLLFKRARFEGLAPKKKKKKKDYGVFLLRLPTKKPMVPKKFDEQLKKEKLKIREELITEIKRRYTNEKKKIDVNAMLAKYMEVFPETRLPPPKKKKGKRGKKGKKGKKGNEDEKQKEGEDKKGEEKKEGEKDDKEGKATEVEGEGKEDTIAHPSKIGMTKSKMVQLPEEMRGPLKKSEKEKMDVVPWEEMLPKPVPDPVYVPEITQLSQAREIEEAEIRRKLSVQRASDAPVPSDKMQELLDREAEQQNLRARAMQPQQVTETVGSMVNKAASGKRTSIGGEGGRASRGGRGGAGAGRVSGGKGAPTRGASGGGGGK